MPRTPAVLRRLLATVVALAVAVLPLVVPAPAEAVTRTLTVLVLPVHFGTKLDTKASATKLVQTEAGEWLASVSRQRLNLKSTVMSVTKVEAGCSAVTERARAAAIRKGYRLNRYDVVVVLAPTCAGYGNGDDSALVVTRTSPGRPGTVVLFGRKGRTLPVLLRQLSQSALGLKPTMQHQCYRNGRPVTIDRRQNCVHWRASYDINVMGGGPVAGSFAAPELEQLGWLTSKQVVVRKKGASTIALSPLSGSGVRTVKVVHAKATYWIEYRRSVGQDSSLPPSSVGVRVWRSSAEDTEHLYFTRRFVLIDMQPETDRSSEPLRPGSTWTSPEGSRFGVRSLTAKRAVVTVRFGAAKPTKPIAPRVRTSAGDEVVHLSWSAAADRGRPVTRYELEARDPRGRVVWSQWVSADRPGRASADGLRNGVRTSIRVRAWNDQGASPWGRSTATPIEQRPGLRFVSPAAKALAAGATEEVVLEATPHPVTKQPVVSVEIGGGDVPTVEAHRRSDGRWVARLDMSRVTTFGIVGLQATAVDQNKRSATATTTITVPARLSTPTVLEPTADPPVWEGDTFTVRVQPGVDRLTGEPAERVRVVVCFQQQDATAANGWTVTFDRSALRSPSGGEAREWWFWVRSESGEWFKSPWVERTIDVR